MEPHVGHGNAMRIRISCWILVGLSGIFLSLRLYCKWISRRRFFWDDYVLILAWATVASSVGATEVNINNGLGQHVWTLSPDQLIAIGIGTSAASVPSILAAAWSKTSFVITLYILFTARWQRVVIAFIGVSMNIFMTFLALLSFLRCSPPEKIWKPFTVEGKCWSNEAYLSYAIFAGAYSASVDFILAILPWQIILKTQLSTKEKIGLCVAMSMGCAAGATAIVKIAYLPLLDSGDFSYYGCELIIYGTAESAVTIMAASIPMLRLLVRDHLASGSSRANFGVPSAATTPLSGSVGRYDNSRGRNSSTDDVDMATATTTRLSTGTDSLRVPSRQGES